MCLTVCCNGYMYGIQLLSRGKQVTFLCTSYFLLCLSVIGNSSCQILLEFEYLILLEFENLILIEFETFILLEFE
jgi:hypothetical protein